MTKTNLKEFKQRAAEKALFDRLRAAILGFKEVLHVGEGQLLDRMSEVLPPTRVMDETRLPRIPDLTNDYMVAHPNKISCLYGVVRMAVITWWFHKEGIGRDAGNVEALCKVLENLKRDYNEIQPSDTGRGFTFTEFYVWMQNSKND
jgi:hypothetical protein